MAPRLEERTELKCRSCGELVPTAQYSYSQKKKQHRRRCPPCVACALYLRGDGPKPADLAVSEAKHPEEYGRIELTEQLLPPQKLSGVTHLKTIVVEPTASGPGQRRARTEMRKNVTESNIPVTYQNSSSAPKSKSKQKSVQRKSRAANSSQESQRSKSRDERDVAEELLSDNPAASSSKKSSKKGQKALHFEEAGAGFVGGSQLDVEQAAAESFVKLKATPKPKHTRTPSTSDQARALYMRQLSGRKALRASRDFDAEELEEPELFKGGKGRKRLSVMEGGYPRESMKPGPERVVGGGK